MKKNENNKEEKDVETNKWFCKDMYVLTFNISSLLMFQYQSQLLLAG